MKQISLAAARVNARLTQQEVADKINVSKGTIISWEAGKTFPSVKHMRLLCEAYNMAMDDIFLPV